MGKTEPTLGGKPKTRNEIKRKAASARSKGPIVLEVQPDEKGPGGSGHHEKWSFKLRENATPEFIKEKLDVAPVAVSFHSSDNAFSSIGNGIYLVKNLEVEGQRQPDSHMVLVVAYGYTEAGRIFFLVQNSWGLQWGVNGYGRIFINQNSGVTVIYP